MDGTTAYDFAIAFFLSGLVLVLWSLQLFPIAPIVAAFSSYWAKDAIWQIYGDNRSKYRDYLEGIFAIPEAMKNKKTTFAGIFCIIAAILSYLTIYIFQTSNAQVLTESSIPIYSFTVPFAAGYMGASMIYFWRPEFIFDGEAISSLGWFLMLPESVKFFPIGILAFIFATFAAVAGVLVPRIQKRKISQKNRRRLIIGQDGNLFLRAESQRMFYGGHAFAFIK
jgi:hypothetical protein